MYLIDTAFESGVPRIVVELKSHAGKKLYVYLVRLGNLFGEAED